MNFKLMFFALLCGASTAFGQTETPSATAAPVADDTLRTLINLKKIRKIGLYIAPEAQYAQFAESDFTGVAGSSAMLVFNQRFAIGLTGFSTVERNFSPKSVAPLYLRAAFGGLRMEFTPRPNRAVHLSFPLILGRGMARADSTAFRSGGGHGHHDDEFWDGNGSRRRSATFFVAQPGIRLEANLIRFVKIFAGADYRIGIVDRSVTGVPNNALQGMSASAGLKIGIFDLKTRPLKKLWKR